MSGDLYIKTFNNPAILLAPKTLAKSLGIGWRKLWSQDTILTASSQRSASSTSC